MSGEERRKILERVASGELSPENAAELIDALNDRGPAKTTEDEKVTAIRVQGTFRTLRIEGDPSVKTAVAEGEHRARVENGTMIFDADPDDDGSGYVLFGPRPLRDRDRERNRERRRESRHRRRVSARVDLGAGRRFTWEGGRPPVLRIRMNPELPLEVDMTAGSARVEGITGPIVADLTAGSARFEGVRSPFRAEVDAGSVQVSGRFDRGDSAIRCTAGKVNLFLEKGSSVRIVARTTMGKVKLPDDNSWKGFIGAGKHEAVVGSGEGTLEVEATTGAVSVDVE